MVFNRQVVKTASSITCLIFLVSADRCRHLWLQQARSKEPQLLGSAELRRSVCAEECRAGGGCVLYHKST